MANVAIGIPVYNGANYLAAAIESLASFADVRTVAQQPETYREDITDFAARSAQITTGGTANAVVCASKYGRTVPPALGRS